MRALGLACLLCACARPAKAPVPALANTPASESAPEVTIGSADPIALLDMAADGRWVAICQARADTDGSSATSLEWSLDELQGDALKAYLVWTAGAGEPFDAFIAKSQDDRFIAITRGGAAVAIDTQSRASFELAGATLVDDDTDRPYRTIAFGTSHVAFARGNDIAIRSLDAGTERVVTIANGRVWEVEVEAGGRWAKVGVVKVDTDGNGKLEGPRRTGFPWERAERCLPSAKQRILRDDGDRLTTTWIDLVTGTAVSDPHAVAPVDAHLLYRDDRDSLVLDGRVLAKDCEYGVHAISHTPPRVYTGCGFASNVTTAPLSVLGGATARTTSLVFTAPNYCIHRACYSDAEPVTITDRFLCIHDRCLDVETGTEREVDGYVSHRFGHLAVFQISPHGRDDWRDARWVVIDLLTGVTSDIPDSLDQAAQFDGPLILISASIGGDDPVTPYDIRTVQPVPLEAGSMVVGHDLAHRRYLIGNDDADYSGFPRGPYRWLPVDP